MPKTIKTAVVIPPAQREMLLAVLESALKNQNPHADPAYKVTLPTGCLMAAREADKQAQLVSAKVVADERKVTAWLIEQLKGAEHV